MSRPFKRLDDPEASSTIWCCPLWPSTPKHKLKSTLQEVQFAIRIIQKAYRRHSEGALLFREGGGLGEVC